MDPLAERRELFGEANTGGLAPFRLSSIDQLYAVLRLTAGTIRTPDQRDCSNRIALGHFCNRARLMT